MTAPWQLQGHVHERWSQDGRMINVGVDATGFCPISEAEIAALIADGPARRAQPSRTELNLASPVDEEPLLDRLHALDELSELGASVRISYDLTTTRLHAKAWIFHRNSGFSTAYVGSSNLTHSAQVTGLEWNVRASSARNPDVVAKFAAVFDTYWPGQHFVDYEPDRFEDEQQRASRSTAGPHIMLSPLEPGRSTSGTLWDTKPAHAWV